MIATIIIDSATTHNPSQLILNNTVNSHIQVYSELQKIQYGMNDTAGKHISSLRTQNRSGVSKRSDMIITRSTNYRNLVVHR